MLKKDNEYGATMIEYALITALVVVVSVVGFTRLGASEVNALTTSGDAVAKTSTVMKHDDGTQKTFQEIMAEVGHPLAAAGGSNPDNQNTGTKPR